MSALCAAKHNPCDGLLRHQRQTNEPDLTHDVPFPEYAEFVPLHPPKKTVPYVRYRQNQKGHPHVRWRSSDRSVSEEVTRNDGPIEKQWKNACVERAPRLAPHGPEAFPVHPFVDGLEQDVA